MQVDRDQFFKSFLDNHSDEMLNKAQALKMEAEQQWVGGHNSMHVKGLQEIPHEIISLVDPERVEIKDN